MAEHAYPSELAQFVSAYWNRTGGVEEDDPNLLSDSGSQPEVLEGLISVCFQASLLREELRPVTFRIIVCNPSCFPRDLSGHHSPTGYHVLEFDEPREFNQRELRTLSQAAKFDRSLIGVRVTSEGRKEIWGIVHSGLRSLREISAWRKAAAPLPSSTIICVNGPGYLEVYRGSILVGQLRDGLVFDESMNVFQSLWLPDQFASVRAEIHSLHEADAARNSREGWAKVDPQLIRKIGQQFVKRLISSVQGAHHGGTLIVIPDEQKEALLAANPYLNVKYRFVSSEPRARYRTVMLAILAALAKAHGGPGEPQTVGGPEYERSADQELLALEEVFFELAFFIAELTSVDGAVLLTKRFEVLGLGGEITCNAAEVTHIARALDIEGESTLMESADGVGTRHRSAFRFAASVPGSIVVVVSQDDDVRFIRSKDGVVTYWNHRPSAQIS